MIPGKRTEKIGLEIQRIIGEALIQKVRDPRVGFATITSVKVAPDLRVATVYVSVMGSDKERKDTLIALNYAKGFFQQLIGEAIKIRFTPKLTFILDASIDEVTKIDSILNKIHAEKASNELDSAGEQKN